MARTGKMQQRRGGFRSKARKLIALSMGGVLLLSSGLAAADQLREGLLGRSLSGEITNVDPSIDNAVATCSFSPAAAGRAAPASLTLSQTSLTATLVCTGTQIVTVPENLLNVCDPKQNADNGKCVFGGTNPAGKEVKLTELLGTDRHIQWTEIQQEPNSERGAGSTKAWTLQLEDGDFPVTDKSFLVGCQDSTKGKQACKVTVNVEARASSVADRNVVTCAYGKKSNPEPLKVEMTTDNNTLTLQCGSEGILHPITYKTRYCDPEAANVQECNEKDYTGILPSFVESWWTNVNDGKSSATLTIPETEFPESDQQFRLGCVPKSPNAPPSGDTMKTSKGNGSQTHAATSNCNVIVTVRSGSSASSTGQMVATVSGAAALLGLLAGSL
ncbi:srs domain-containing protein [Neospora caninum Liverpool]|uniref:Srs domain-containing protein n=1 Tax=Neospora caninum (strain Liverpool) TaxID=572307 RepID=F0VA33_NEOCL|nr:srs domain-containing protein [Neospora caninum Liverpool]CBZ50522.1 srs domain-containing protein [Neospora caninum Liverpool]CEL65132.1 TPA: SRS domain-containing protein [Neospora caninum Liverpool]|eukprot:XP_003880555.1 srs domain-containing protein [Neospora caninum Liverpool]